MKRYKAIETIVNTLTGNEFIISCTGMISRELFSIKDTPRNFYTLGSMGLSSSIGLGLAITQPNKKVIVIEGDGNVLMNLGTLPTIGNLSPKNLIHIVLDNECHESTGGQSTVSNTIELDRIARLSGFQKNKKVDSIEELSSIIKECLNSDGPSFILVKVDKERKDVPRVSIDPVEIKNRMISSINKSKEH